MGAGWMQVRLAQYLHERLGTINQKLRTLQTVRRRLALLLRQLESAAVATCPASKSLGHVAPFSVSPSFQQPVVPVDSCSLREQNTLDSLPRNSLLHVRTGLLCVSRDQ